MPQRRTVLVASAAVALASVLGTSQAQTQALPAPLPGEVALELPGALWSGAARLRYFGFDVYDSQLWVAPGFRADTFAQHGLALELTYLRALSGQDIAERSLKEMRRSADLPAPQAQRWLDALRDAIPDVKPADRLTGLHIPGFGARFWHNGQPRPSVRDPEFSRLFFGIWLSHATSEPQLRRGLLARQTP